LGFSPASAIVIGDKESDIEFGRRAGATTILIAAGASTADFRIRPDLVAPNLIEAARAVTSLRA
jgi:phosphoglycolate phosphatase-like HAD superfamily hydrolase